jgi:hypothetical protein
VSVSLVRTANFGKSKSGLTGQVGYQVVDINGSVIVARNTSGVDEVVPGSGIYRALIEFPDNFRGVVAWDTGGLTPAYAAEEYNSEENNASIESGAISNVSADVEIIRQMTTGRWHLNAEKSTMTFYREDNETPIFTYELFDENDNPSIESVFQRRLVTP